MYYTDILANMIDYFERTIERSPDEIRMGEVIANQIAIENQDQFALKLGTYEPLISSFHGIPVDIDYKNLDKITLGYHMTMNVPRQED